jgi:hypothetical protein
MDKVWEWLPWLQALLLCGVINAVVAYQKLYRDAKSPFFRPWNILGFYIWLIIQIALPATFFWFYGKVVTKPSINPEFYLSAIAVGFFFTLLANSNSDLGFVNFSIDKYYGFLNQLAYNRIAASQTGKLTQFKQALKQYLIQTPGVIDPALDYLKDYVKSDVALKLEEQTRTDYLQQIESASQQLNSAAKADLTTTIAQQVLRRRDYPAWLKSMRAPQALSKSLK